MEHQYIKKILYGYMIIIFFGGLLLYIPVSHIGELSFIDAIFTSASATCVTGLIVTSTSENFTFIGEAIILLLIQIGGIGYMTIVIIFFIFMKNSLSIDEKRAMKQSLDLPDLHVVALTKKIVLIALIIELFGALILTIQFTKTHQLIDATWLGIFHSISAFNNAGFSLFTDSLMGYQNDTISLLTISFLIIFGGIGYFVIIELYENKKSSKRLTLHTRIMIYGTIILILLGMILFLSIEWNNPKTFGTLSFYEKILGNVTNMLIRNSKL